MIELYLHSPHPPAVVLAALRAYTSEWRESQIPPILWRDGVAAIECRIAGSTCRLSYRRRWNRSVDSSQFLRAEAKVQPDRDGSLVKLSASYELPQLKFFVIVAGILTVVAVSVDGTGALFLPLLALSIIGGHYIWARMANRRLSRTSDPYANYLVNRLEAAVARAGYTAKR
jgi:hypothetical protein